MRALEAGSLTRRGRTARLAVAVAVAVGMAACGDDGGGNAADDPEQSDAADDGGATSAPADTTTTTLTPEQQVLADYRAADDALVAAYDPPDPEHPDLLRHWGGDLLDEHQVQLREYRFEGLSVVATTNQHQPEVVSLVGDRATVRDCIVEILETLNTETREPYSQPRRVAQRAERELRHVDGTWRVVDGETLEMLEGDRSC